MDSYGFVYVLSNDSMPGVYKIGCTSKSPLMRSKQLAANTGAPESFNIVCYGELSDFNGGEKFLHDEFAKYRVSDRREFFSLNIDQLEELVDFVIDMSVHHVLGSSYHELAYFNKTKSVSSNA